MNPNSRYWERRLARDAFDEITKVEMSFEDIADVFLKASLYIQKQAEGIFQKYQTKHGLSETEAEQLLKRMTDPTSYKEMLEKLRNSQETEEKRELLKELEAPAYQARIRRAEELNHHVDQIMKKVADQTDQKTEEILEEAAEDGYYESIYRTQQRADAAFSFSDINPDLVDKVIHAPISGKSFSKRIWDNTDELAKVLKEELLQGVLTQRSERETAQAIADRMHKGLTDARRLVRTESNRIYTELQMKGLEESGVEEYMFLATLDLRTSKICREHDGKIYKVKERKTGDNCPPLHPWCRSTIMGIISRRLLAKLKRDAIDPTTGKHIKVPLSMTYSEWYKKYVEEENNISQRIDNSLNLTRRQYDNYKKRLDGDFNLSYEEFLQLKNDKELWKAYQQAYRESAKNEKFYDLTEIWKCNVKRNKAKVTPLNEYTAPDGQKYPVTDPDVILDHEPHEIDTAELLSKATGSNIGLCPRVAGRHKNVSTPDYIQDGKTKWDKKRPEGKGKDAIRDIVKRCEEQGDSFIIDLSLWKGDFDNAVSQAENLFSWPNTQFIKRVAVIKDGKIVKVMGRK